METSTKTWDLIIVGAGPAGITAGVYAARKRMDFMVVTKDLGGQAAWSGDIENYTGFQVITGPELTSKFEDHLRKYEIDLKLGEEVRAVYPEGEKLVVETEGERYEAGTVIVATGRVPRKLNVPGEAEFRNRGMTYCATCDGPLFAGLDVAVIGGGNSALDAVLQLIKIARRVCVILKLPEFTGDPIMVKKVRQSRIVEILSETEVTEIVGEEMVTGLKVARRGEERLLEVKGVFIEIGSEAASGFVREVGKNQSGEILVDCRSRTSLPGLFAAGDVTDVPAKQVIVAAGEGAKAALSAFTYLSKKEQA